MTSRKHEVVADAGCGPPRSVGRRIVLPLVGLPDAVIADGPGGGINREWSLYKEKTVAQGRYKYGPDMDQTIK